MKDTKTRQCSVGNFRQLQAVDTSDGDEKTETEAVRLVTDTENVLPCTVFYF